MKIDRSIRVAGQDAKTVRDILRQVDRGYFSANEIAELLHEVIWREHVDDLVGRRAISPSDRAFYLKNERWINSDRCDLPGRRVIASQTAAARALVQHLHKDGMVELREGRLGERNAEFELTMKGSAFAAAAFVPRMNRAKADVLIQGVLERAAQINERNDLLHWVSEIRIFGSYLADTDDLGDIDLAIRLERRPVEEQFGEASRKFARSSGKKFNNILQALYYPERLVRQLLKNRSPYVSIHDVDELERNPQFGGKTIYTFSPPESEEVPAISSPSPYGV